MLAAINTSQFPQKYSRPLNFGVLFTRRFEPLQDGGEELKIEVTGVESSKDHFIAANGYDSIANIEGLSEGKRDFFREQAVRHRSEAQVLVDDSILLENWDSTELPKFRDIL